jgi:hypothetical protein
VFILANCSCLHSLNLTSVFSTTPILIWAFPSSSTRSWIRAVIDGIDVLRCCCVNPRMGRLDGVSPELRLSLRRRTNGVGWGPKRSSCGVEKAELTIPAEAEEIDTSAGFASRKGDMSSTLP